MMRPFSSILESTTALVTPVVGLARKALEHFAGDRSGTVAVIFGVAMIPIIGLAGSALDYSRVSNDRETALAAADSAALAAVRSLRLPDAQVREVVRAYLDTNLPSHLRGVAFTLTINDDRSGVQLDVSGATQTTILPVIGIEELRWSASTEAVNNSIFTEIALVLDVTGSMRPNIGALRTAANDFVDVIFDGRDRIDDARIALVPYRYTVNIGNGPTQLAWMDTTGDALHHGENFEGRTYRDRRCNRPRPQRPRQSRPSASPSPPSRPSSPPPPSTPPSSDWGALNGEVLLATHGTTDTTMLDMVFDSSLDVAGVVNELIGVPEAHAVGSWPYGPTPTDATPPLGAPGDDCRRTLTQVNHFDLFNAMGEGWAGCVEARPEPFDTADTPPGANADTRWVPYLWPDERDEAGGQSNPNAHSRNDYLETTIPSWVNWPRANRREDARHQTWVWKYRDDAPDSDYASFIQQGPNAACPNPIVPLTGDREALEGGISQLEAKGAAGTNAPFGLTWGWRVLSPGVPFTEGLPYDPQNNQKIIILMTDGENDVQEQSNSYNEADYGAYGYVARGRLGADRAAVRNRLDAKLSEVCNAVRASGREIIVYTVMFDPGGGIPTSLRNLYRSCATEPDMYFEASNAEALVNTFSNIAGDIRRLRLTR